MNIFVEDTTDSLVTVETVEDVFLLRFKPSSLRESTELCRILDSIDEGVQSRTGVRIVLDLDNVKYLASREIGKLVSILKSSKRQRGKLAVCCLSGVILEVFEGMHLTSIFDVFDGVSEAVQAVSK